MSASLGALAGLAALGGLAAVGLVTLVRAASRAWRGAPPCDGEGFAERSTLKAELERLAFYDPLTGLANRTLFHRSLAEALASPGRTSVLLLDLDNFKTVNDTLGHAAGDAVLVEVAARLTAARLHLLAARLGGDEFALLLPADADAAVAERAADVLVRALQAPYVVSGRELFLGASVGLAHAEARGASAGDLLRDADTAMYRAKAQGRGRWARFTPAMRREDLRRLELEGALRGALARGELDLHYQPVVRLTDGLLVGAEALLRWERPGLGPVSPAEFVPVTEATGLIVPLGAWLLLEACVQASRWQRPGRPVSVSVNVSPRQVLEPDFAEVVERALETSRLAPERLVLELTESVVLFEVEGPRRHLERLRALGVRVALDDFGTGSSTLARLRHFPVDVLKVDRSLVAGVAEGGEGAALAQAVLALAGALGLSAVAEGVETHAQRDALGALGCELGQGYLFARPLPLPALRQLLHGTPAPLPHAPAEAPAPDVPAPDAPAPDASALNAAHGADERFTPAPESERLIYGNTAHGLFRIALKGQLSPAAQEALRAAGLDVERPVAPHYPVETWVRLLAIAAEELAAGGSREEGFRRLGTEAVRGVSHTALGRALGAMARVVGPDRALARLDRSLRSADNYIHTRLTPHGPGRSTLWVNDVLGQPAYYEGILAECLRFAGARDVRVEAGPQEGAGCTFRMAWAAPS